MVLGDPISRSFWASGLRASRTAGKFLEPEDEELLLLAVESEFTSSFVHFCGVGVI